MKKTFVAAAVALVAMVPALQALAVEVVNEDDKEYTLSVNDGQTITAVKIGAGASIKLECATCQVSGADGAIVEAVEEETIVIRDGKLEVGG